MDLSSFCDLPDDAQLWVFGFARPLSKRDRKNIRKHLDAFLPPLDLSPDPGARRLHRLV